MSAFGESERVELVGSLEQAGDSFLELISEEQLVDFQIQVKELLKQSPKLVIASIGYHRDFGFNSLYFYKYTLNKFFVPVVLENIFIRDFEQKLSEDFYEEGTIILVNNIQLEEEEYGFKECRKERGVVFKSQMEVLNFYEDQVKVFVNCDKVNFFSSLTTQSLAQFQINVVGVPICDYLQLVKRLTAPENLNPKTLLFGGPFKLDNLLFLLNLSSFVDHIFVYDEIGFRMSSGNLEEDEA